MKDLDVEGEVELRWGLEIWVGIFLKWMNLFRTGDDFLAFVNEAVKMSVSIKRAEELLASQQGFCTLGLLTLSDLWLRHALFGLNVCQK